MKVIPGQGRLKGSFFSCSLSEFWKAGRMERCGMNARLCVKYVY
jgi:hypothetical protein